MHYHRNAVTNIYQRKNIQESAETVRDLADKYGISHVTAAKWIGKGEGGVGGGVQLSNYIPNLKRGNLYRILLHYRLNKLTEEERREIKKFRKYPPGYLHIDCFYLPKINGKRWYCYLAVDRATRLLFLRVYPRKDQYAAGDFLIQALGFYPFRVHTILTDNGTEFSNIGSTGFYGRKLKSHVPFELTCELAGIDYRKTKFNHPWTNGMAERMVRTAKDHTTNLEKYETSEEAAIGL